MTSRKKMCTNKVSFYTKAKAEEAGKRWGHRVYECPVCFCWHTTSKEDWKEEFVTSEKLNKILHEKEHEFKIKYEKKRKVHVATIKALEEKVSKLEARLKEKDNG